jgi:ADP-heptose:LPS heptosyltransferase
MKIATMRFLDRALGVPCCALLTAARRLGPARTGGAGPLRRILFVKLVEQGTTVLARPAIVAACAAVGRENVFFLVLEENRGILDAMALIPEGNVIAPRGDTPVAAALGLAGALRRIRGLGISAVVDLEFFSRASAVLAFLSGAPLAAGLHPGPGAGPWRGDLLTHRVLYQPELHTSQLYETLVRALAVPGAELPALPFAPPARERWGEPSFRPAPEEAARAARLLDVPAGGRLFLVNANAGDLEPLRRWPAERYGTLIRGLLREHPGATVACTGSPAEAEAVAALVAAVASPQCVSLAGRTGLRDLLALLARCDALITNDSGPAHFAGLTATPTVVLFGPETPLRFGPLATASRALTASLACSPCLSAHNNRRSACRNNRCLQAIDPDAVLAAVREILPARPRAVSVSAPGA